MKKINNLLQIVLAAVFFQLLFNGCHNFYKVMQSPAGTATEKSNAVDSLKTPGRYFILRNGDRTYKMTNININTDKKTLACTLDTLGANHSLHLNNGLKSRMRYQKNNPEEYEVLNEVHLFILQDNNTAMGQYTLALENIQKIEVIQFDKERTNSSYVIGAVGYSLGTIALAVIIIAAIKSSCPFVSAYDGHEFSLQGEIYGGAIYPQLARHDYMPLRILPMADGSMQVKISNELKERQFTDMADLWVITHDKNSKVFADESGKLFSITAPQTPIYATLNDKTDARAALLKSGDNALLHMDDTSANTTNEVTMKFDKPASAKKAKLVLSLKNSYFLDLLYGEMAKGFGNYYNTYISQQRKKPVDELLKWVKEQHIPLTVSVKSGSGWKTIADITTIGPLATRNIIVPVEIPETNEPLIQIKLSSGFMFWEIDYAALDYSDESTFSVEKITPSKATDELGKNILPELNKEDHVYLAQPDIGNAATIIYTVSPLKDESKTRSYILHTKGYYEHIRDFKNKPDIVFLNQFKQPGAFPRYGIQLYKKLVSYNINTLAKSN